MKKTLFLLIVLLWLPAIVKAGSFNINNQLEPSRLRPPTGFHSVPVQDDRAPMPKRHIVGYDQQPGLNRPHFPRHHQPAAPTPIPASIILLGTGLVGLFGIKRKIKRG